MLNSFYSEKINNSSQSYYVISFVYEDDDNNMFTAQLFSQEKILCHVIAVYKILVSYYQIIF